MSLELINVNKSFGGVEVVKSANISVQQGEFVVFVGPSGCGKSTMLRMIAGLESITSGKLIIDGQDVTHTPSSQRGIAMVFQSYALYPHLSVFDNMAFSLRIAKMPKKVIRSKVMQAAEILHLEAYLDRLPKALSGGQRQRVAIGRAIVRSPKVFLFDEPLSNLDAALRTEMRVELSALHKQLGSTMIYVTHDQVEAMTLADRIVVINGGVIDQVGSPMELYQTPQTPFVAGFIGSPKMNFFSDEQAARRGADLCGVRPENIVVLGETPEPADATLFTDVQGQVTHVEKLGADTLIYAQTEQLGPLLVRHPALLQANTGDPVALRFAEADVHKFKNGVRTV